MFLWIYSVFVSTCSVRDVQIVSLHAAQCWCWCWCWCWGGVSQRGSADQTVGVSLWCVRMELTPFCLTLCEYKLWHFFTFWEKICCRAADRYFQCLGLKITDFLWLFPVFDVLFLFVSSLINILASHAVFSSLFRRLFLLSYFTLFTLHCLFLCATFCSSAIWPFICHVGFCCVLSLYFPSLPPLPCSLSPDGPQQVSVLQVWQHHFDLPGSLERHRLDCEEENTRGWCQNLLLQLGLLVLQLQLQLHRQQHLPNRQRRVLVWVYRREDEQCRQHHHHWYCAQHWKHVLTELKAAFNRSDFHQSICLTKSDFGGGTKCNRNTKHLVWKCQIYKCDVFLVRRNVRTF